MLRDMSLGHFKTATVIPLEFWVIVIGKPGGFAGEGTTYKTGAGDEATKAWFMSVGVWDAAR